MFAVKQVHSPNLWRERGGRWTKKEKGGTLSINNKKNKGGLKHGLPMDKIYPRAFLCNVPVV